MVIVAVLVGTGAGGYGLYRYRKEHNTQLLLDQAQAARVQGNRAAALSAYRRYLQRKPKDEAALEAYVEVLLEALEASSDVIGATVRALQKLVRVQPENVDALGELAGLYVKVREFVLAQQVAESWVELAPTSVEAPITLAQALLGVGQAPAATETLISAIGRMPDEPRLSAVLVRVLAFDLKRPDEAADWLSHALRVGAESDDVQLAAYYFYHSRNESVTAEHHLKLARQLAPDDIDVVLAATMFYLSQSRFDEARAALDRAEVLAPDDRRVALARAEYAHGQTDEDTLVSTAEDLVERAGEQDVELIVRAADLFLRVGRLDRTEECLNRLDNILVGNEPGEVVAVVSLLKGAFALAKGRSAVAVGHLRTALGEQPTNTRALKMLALAFWNSGDLEAGANMLERALALKPDDAHTRLQLAEIAWQAGRPRRSRNVVDGLQGPLRATVRLIQLACELREARREGTLSTSRTRHEQALNELAATSTADDSTAKRWRLRCLVLAGQVEKAMASVRDEWSGPQSDPKLGAELGQLLLAHERYAEARELAGELIQRFPEAVEGHLLRVKTAGASGRLSEFDSYVDNCGLGDEPCGRVLEAVGDELLAADRADDALKVLRRAAELQPNNVSAWQKVVLRTSDLNEARLRSEAIRAIEGDAGWRWKYSLAHALLRLDSSSAALMRARDLLEQCLTDRPRWVAARLLLGHAHERNGMTEKAAAAYQAALAYRPALYAKPVALRLVALLGRLGRFMEADVVLNSIAETIPDDQTVLQLRAQQEIRRQDFDAALEIAEQLLELRPDDATVAAMAAELQYRTGDAIRAEQIARHAIEQSPLATAPLWSLARILLAQGRTDEAEAQVRRAVARADTAAHHLLLAQFLVRIDKAPDAEPAIARAQELAPDDASVWAASTDYWGGVGRRAQQIACAHKAIELRGMDPETSLVLARILSAGGSPQERADAAAIIRRRLYDDPNDAPTLVLDAQAALNELPPDVERAESSLSRALSFDRTELTARRLLAALQVQRGQFEIAIGTVEGGLSFAPDDVDLLLMAGRIHLHRGDDERAIPLLRHLLSIKPRSLDAQRLVTTAYQRTGQVDRAIELLERILPARERAAAETLNLASLYETRGDFDRAEALLADAVRLDPASQEAFEQLLTFHVRRSDRERVVELAEQRRVEYPRDVGSQVTAADIMATADHAAMRAAGLARLDKIAQDFPAHAGQALFRKGLAHYRVQEFTEAEKQFTAALQHDGGAADAVNALAWMYAVDLGRAGDALAVIERFLQGGGGENAQLMDTHATVLMHLSEFEAAKTKLEACIKLVGQTSTRAAAHYHLGLVLQRMGQSSDARSLIREALRLADRLGGLTEQERAQARRLMAGSGIDDTSGVPD